MNTVKSSPHIHGPLRTDKAMLMVAIALLPAALWGVYAFGFRALFTLIVAIASSLLTEFLLGKVSHESTLRDGSALVTGLLVGMNMPPPLRARRNRLYRLFPPRETFFARREKKIRISKASVRFRTGALRSFIKLWKETLSIWDFRENRKLSPAYPAPGSCRRP